MFDNPRLAAQLKDCFGVDDAAGLKRYLGHLGAGAKTQDASTWPGLPLLRFLMDVNESYRQLEAAASLSATQPAPNRLFADTETVELAYLMFDSLDRLTECNAGFRRMYAPIESSLTLGLSYATVMRDLHGYLVERHATRLPYPQWIAEQERQCDGVGLVAMQVDGHWRWMAQTRTHIGFRLCQHLQAPELERGLASLTRFKQDAEEAERRHQATAARSGHAIRTLIDVMLGMTGLGLETTLLAEQREYLQTVKSAAGSLLTHVNELLGKPGLGAAPAVERALPFSLRRLVLDTVKPLAVQAHARNVELQVRIDSTLVDGWRGEVGELRLILQRLIENGIRFTTQGHVTVEAVPPSLGNARDTLEFAVADTGIGIAPQQQALIFDAFSESGSNNVSGYGGSGPDLAACRRLAARMGGTLRVDSVPGRGSRFRLSLPLETADDESLPPQEKANLSGMTALVVDERPLSRRWLQDMLTEWGLRVTVAGSAADASRLLQTPTTRTDFVLIDRELTSADALLSLVGPQQALSRKTVVLCRTLNWEQEQAELRARGLAQTIAKPVDGTELLRLLLRIVGRAAAAAAPAMQGLPPLSILLAEDHPVQQRMTVKMLERMGHTVTAVGNGQQAVEASATQAFELILMDVQMPILDGLAATRAIRAREAQCGADAAQLIVAMTAVAMPGDRALCLEAGMDGYVSKPVDRGQWIAEIRRVLARQHSQTAWRATAAAPLVLPPPPQPADPDLDLPDLDLDLVTERWRGRSQAFSQGMATWLRGFTAPLQALNRALDASDFGGASEAALPLVMQSAVLGASAIEHQLRALVHQVRAKDLEAARLQASQLPALLRRLEYAYRDWQNAQEPQVPQAVTP